MEQELREASKCAASNVAASINDVAASIADEPFTVQCSSKDTVLRNEQLKDMLALILESAVIKQASNIKRALRLFCIDCFVDRDTCL